MQKSIAKVDEVTINFALRYMRYKGEKVDLTRVEGRILYCLCKHKKVLSGDELKDCIYKHNMDGGPVSDSYRVVMTTLRKKFKANNVPLIIYSVRGRSGGYRLKYNCEWLDDEV